MSFRKGTKKTVTEMNSTGCLRIQRNNWETEQEKGGGYLMIQRPNWETEQEKGGGYFKLQRSNWESE